MPETLPQTLASLRRAISALEGGHDPALAGGAAKGATLFALGEPELDDWLGGGLSSGALHEVHGRLPRDAGAAAGFGLGLVMRAAGSRPLVWLRQDLVADEVGELSGTGVAAFGLDPARLLVVRAGDPAATLRAAEEALRSPALGAALVEIWGEPKILDLKTSRRLTLAAESSGATLVMIRLQAEPLPSSATSRWGVTAAASTPLEANAPGRPAFAARLLRHRSGLPCRTWRLEWDRDSLSFATAPLSRPVVPLPAIRPAAAQTGRHESGTGGGRLSGRRRAG